MNRIQKKCMIVSAGIHLLLAVMLIFGPGFFAGKPDNSPPVLTFIALKTTDDDSSGGGDNTVKAPPALGGDPAPPVTPAPVLTPAPVIAQPEPVPQPPERVQPKQPERDLPPVPKDPPRVNTTPRIDSTPKPAPRKPHEINVDTNVVTSSAADAKAKREAQQKAAAAARAADAKRIAGINSLFKSATTGVRTGTAGSTEIRLSGPGGGGVPYGNFLSAVKKAYDDAWSPPNGVPETTVSVRITIARDGTILSAHITDASGNAALDGSVQKALDRVKAVPPLPDSETRDSRTVTIGFNPENK
jgi:TonB family protein